MKNIHPKNYKVMFGLVALLFVVSFTQTGVLLKILESIRSSQVAQVSQTAASAERSGGGTAIPTSSSCLQVTPLINQDSGSVSIWAPLTHSSQNYMMHFRVKNNCPYIVHMIDSKTLGITTNDVLMGSQYFKIQRMDGVDAYIDMPLPTNIDNLVGRYEGYLCNTCPNGATVYRNSPVGTATYNGAAAIKAFSIPVGATVDSFMNIAIDVPDGNVGWYRVAPIKLKFFRQTALATGSPLGIQVDASEITTYTFATPETLATDYTKFPAN